jgi:hypothetical protein
MTMTIWMAWSASAAGCRFGPRSHSGRPRVYAGTPGPSCAASRRYTADRSFAAFRFAGRVAGSRAGSRTRP